MNHISIIGNLVRDPETSTANNGTQITRFSVAVRRSLQREGSPEADFFSVTTFGKQAENCHKYLKKGRKVAVEGEMQSNTYTGSDSIQRTTWSILAQGVEFLSPTQNESRNEPTPPPIADKVPAGCEPIADDDLPF